MKKTMSRQELSELLSKAAERKMSERELFMMRAVEDPSNANLYSELIDWLELDIRYVGVAAVYYSDDYGSLESGYDDDLLFLIGSSDVPPKTYAQYLREIPASDRADEKIVHAAVTGLKKAMKDTLGKM